MGKLVLIYAGFELHEILRKMFHVLKEVTIHSFIYLTCLSEPKLASLPRSYKAFCNTPTKTLAQGVALRLWTAGV